ncbi:hypothetical protein SeLEV6574_g02940 [Synchytrium endobioticum]|uniref:Transmembrane protein n=1 Tax=Synchytrium endobioticum TaxID=286115 RepID=A0A507D7U7_9FUNG|nr:hypothetical protein SeLEV6574_g02940 [Synchytrium endobioticum]
MGDFSAIRMRRLLSLSVFMLFLLLVFWTSSADAVDAITNHQVGRHRCIRIQEIEEAPPDFDDIDESADIAMLEPFTPPKKYVAAFFVIFMSLYFYQMNYFDILDAMLCMTYERVIGPLAFVCQLMRQNAMEPYQPPVPRSMAGEAAVVLDGGERTLDLGEGAHFERLPVVSENARMDKGKGIMYSPDFGEGTSYSTRTNSDGGMDGSIIELERNEADLIPERARGSATGSHTRERYSY